MILIFYLFQTDNHLITIYVYLKKALLLHLSNSNIKLFLAKYGYPSSNELTEIFNYLNYRLNAENGYPHEIGIFLRFPLDDVKGFIQKYPCYFIGYWKVYSNVEKQDNYSNNLINVEMNCLIVFYSGRRIEEFINVLILYQYQPISIRFHKL